MDKVYGNVRSNPAATGCIVLSALCLYLLFQIFSSIPTGPPTLGFGLDHNYNSTHTSLSSTQSPTQSPTDYFFNFTGRSSCAFGSPDLHVPLGPTCTDATALLDSMTDGGRRGFQTPYQPRGCDIRFYTTNDICEILSRFEDVIFLGDSMIRHLIGAFAMLLRENYEYGAQAQWLDRDKVLKDCTCDSQSYLLGCHGTEIYDIEQIRQNDPLSLRCPAHLQPRLSFVSVLKHPVSAEDFDKVTTLLSPTRPDKPYAFIYGHGLWNELDIAATEAWLAKLQDVILTAAPYLNETANNSTDDGAGLAATTDTPFWPQIFASPNAAGVHKPDGYLLTQGNVALARFEHAARAVIPKYGVDFFGTWNMSIQANVPDGTHAGIRTNLLKAMTVVQWLDLLDVH